MTEPNLRAPSQVWGRMRIWCEGTEIGDYSDEHCGLFDAYTGFTELRDFLAWNWMTEFNGLSDEKIWDILYGALFGYHGDVELHDSRTVDECRVDWVRYGKFSFLTNWGEQFDKNGKSFIVCRPDGVVRILNRSLGNSSVFSSEVPLGEAIEVMQKFIDWFQGENIRLAGRPPN